MAQHEHSRLIDFHSHYFEAAWYETLPPQGPTVFRQAWPLLSNIEAQLVAMDEAGIDGKVLSAPSRSLVALDEPLALALMQRINDRFAEMVAEHPTRLLALATIDAFHGELAAREAERAILTLGLSGLCVDCARGERFLDSAECRPLFARAAALDVAVFVHPVSPRWLSERLARLGHSGTLLARGTETAASVLALLRSGIYDEFPNLKVVIPMIAASAFLFMGIADLEKEREGGWGSGLPGEQRKKLYVDTMGFDPASLRFALELLGPEHVLLGSDWPIMPIMRRESIEKIFASLNLTQSERQAITSGNTTRLLARHNKYTA
jgi:predicted TIM-barrel fold metal-dependent hydrolase